MELVLPRSYGPEDPYAPTLVGELAAESEQVSVGRLPAHKMCGAL